MKPILSICVVTMNRAEQLRCAIESCLRCNLPPKTEFVVIDNASDDHTEAVVKEISEGSEFVFKYEKLSENIGAGRGRNLAFEKAIGKYVYSLDDDAYIPEEFYGSFFIDSLKVLENDPTIIALTTQIFDNAWNCNRVKTFGTEISNGVYSVPSMCEGSNFLRKDFFESVPYFPNVYGYEGLPPVLMIYDSGNKNCFYDKVTAIHNPLINKWDGTEKNKRILVLECAVPYAIKRKMYPCIFAGVLWLVYKLRCRKHLRKLSDSSEELRLAIKETKNAASHLKRIKFKTVWNLYKEFGKTVF